MKATRTPVEGPRDLVAVLLVSLLAAACLPNSAFAEGPDPDMLPPGVERTLPFSHVEGLSFDGEDLADTSAVWLEAGQTLRVAMRSTPGADFRIHLLRPERLTEFPFLIPELASPEVVYEGPAA